MNMDPRISRGAEPPMVQRDREQTDLARLRALLLAADREATDAKAAELASGLEDRVRRDELLAAITEHLATALRDAEERDPRAMARALSPAVVKCIRREISNSRDEMVEALYPITGRLVRAAVRDAIGKLASDVNARLNAMTSPAIISAQIKSIIFRKPASTFLITSVGSVGSILSALLVDRETGALLRQWRPDASGEAGEASAHGLSSILSALSSFTEQNFREQGSELRTLDLNGRNVILRQSPRHLLALEVQGEAEAQLRSQADAIFDRILDNIDGLDRLDADDVFGRCELTPVAANTNNAPLKALSGALFVLAATGVSSHLPKTSSASSRSRPSILSRIRSKIASAWERNWASASPWTSRARRCRGDCRRMTFRPLRSSVRSSEPCSRKFCSVNEDKADRMDDNPCADASPASPDASGRH